MELDKAEILIVGAGIVGLTIARELVKELRPADVEPSAKVGIRPQLVDWESKELARGIVREHFRQ